MSVPAPTHALTWTGDDPLVSIRGLSYRRRDKMIFENIDLDIRRGKITAIVGPSGCGKTTLLRLIGGQLRPDAGEIEVFGRPIAKASRAELFELRRRMGMLFQNAALLTDLSVFENVAFPIREHTDLDPVLVRNIVLMKLELVGLRNARALYPRALSGGMARRAALARAIALDPLMVMYDEPFAGQDPISMGMLVDLIRSLNDALGLTSIVVSHDLAETSTIADYMVVLAEGRVVGAGTPQELERSDSRRVRQFLEGRPDGPVPFHYPGTDYVSDLMGDSG